MKAIVCRTVKVGVVAIQEPMLREDLYYLVNLESTTSFISFFVLKKIYIVGNKTYEYVNI